MFRYGPGFHHGPYVFGWVALALLVALLVIAVVAVVRLWSGPRGRVDPLRAPPLPTDPALTELRVRYARGDIDGDEYRRRLSDLGYPVQGEPGPPMPPAPPPSPAV